MILVFVSNERFGEVTDLPFTGRVGYRNPNYVRPNDKPEKCEGVYIHGDYPNVEAIYKDKLITPNEYPIDKGAGWYELSNGKSVRGEENAIEAEKNL